MDIALSLDFLVPCAKYGGSIGGNTREEYDALEWEDEREKPPWEKVANNLELLKAKKLEEFAQARWEQETGGLTLPNGAIIKTDRESQALLTGASLYVLQNATATVEWKGANGWVTLTAAEIQQIAMAVRNHVQAAFSREKELAEKVEKIANDGGLAAEEKYTAIAAISW